MAKQHAIPPYQHVKEKRILYVAPHPHAQETATRHVDDVAKMEPCTSKQTQYNNATTKQLLQLKPSCTVLEISTSRKDRINFRSIKITATRKQLLMSLVGGNGEPKLIKPAVSTLLV